MSKRIITDEEIRQILIEKKKADAKAEVEAETKSAIKTLISWVLLIGGVCLAALLGYVFGM